MLDSTNNFCGTRDMEESMVDSQSYVREGLVLERFWAKVEKNGPPPAEQPELGACWLWQASKDHDGYGQVSVGVRLSRRVLRAHRLAWEMAFGEVPDGQLVLHRCNVRGCVNPTHLYLGTQVENTADRIARGLFGKVAAHRPRTGGTLEDRFWRLVQKSEAIDGCWEWVGYCQPGGYGIVKDKQQARRAHIVSWEIHFGPVADELCVLHKCDNRKCVRPDHLFLGTRADNAADRTAKGRTASGDANGARRFPQHVPRGDLHGLHRDPSRAARGSAHGSHTHPESRTTGDDHWSRQFPERRATGERHGSATQPEAVLRGEDCSWAKLTEEQVQAIRAEYAAGGISQEALGKKYGIGQTQVSRIIRGLRWSPA